MDYKEKYNNALDWMRSVYPTLTGAAKEDAEHYFPELAESEDEKIRKELLAVIDDLVLPDAQKARFNAYLEKQKEQKPILEVFGFKVGDAVRLKDGDGRKHIIKSFEEVEGLHGPNFYHVEFEDNSARDSIYPGEEYPNGYYTQMEKFEKEQKPVEWSEADKLYVDECINLIKTDLSTASFESDLRRRLEKGLDLIQQFRFQQEYEWSEEDKKMLTKIINNVNGFDVFTGIVSQNFEQHERKINWLKSLRPQPHWKPSEEQMEALMLAIEGKCPSPTSYLSRRLEDLYRGLANTYGVVKEDEK